MILVVESARAIGCSVTENMEVELARGDHSAIDRLVLELIKVSLVGGCGLTSGHAHFFSVVSCRSHAGNGRRAVFFLRRFERSDE